ncbi:hypothetical protein [Aeromicrobium sp.]|uniref:hypothetical protein n=1 Tax=Aeromicrobium sp. TaxID=1871063 RepID=UPI0030BD9FE2
MIIHRHEQRTGTMQGRLASMSDMPPEDPRISEDPEDDPKHKSADPDLDTAPDDPDAPAPSTGPYG